MKDTKRAYRRYKKEVNFLRRVDNWLVGMYRNHPGELETYRKDILEGKTSKWLRTTGSPCNCWMCSGETKFVREQKQYINLSNEERIS